MNNGWIKIHRGLLHWQWHDDPEMLSLWITLLMMAQCENGEYKGTPVERGQIKTTIKELSTQTGISTKGIRNRLTALTKGKQIGTETANKFTVITICNYDSYDTSVDAQGQTKGKQRANNEYQGATKGQTKGNERANKNTALTSYESDSYPIHTETEGQQKGNKRATKGQTEERKEDEEKSSLSSPIPPTCLSKEVEENKENNKKEIKEKKSRTDWRLPRTESVQSRMSALADQIRPYVNDYGRDMCNAFYRYWVEDQGKGIMRFENVKKYATFQTASRLATWYRQSSGRERSLPPQVEASLPSIDNVSSLPVADKTMLSDSLLKMIDEEYNLQGEDGEWYSCLEDLKRKKNSKSERIKREVERKKSMQ